MQEVLSILFRASLSTSSCGSSDFHPLTSPSLSPHAVFAKEHVAENVQISITCDSMHAFWYTPLSLGNMKENYNIQNVKFICNGLHVFWVCYMCVCVPLCRSLCLGKQQLISQLAPMPLISTAHPFYLSASNSLKENSGLKKGDLFQLFHSLPHPKWYKYKKIITVK